MFLNILKDQMPGTMSFLFSAYAFLMVLRSMANHIPEPFRTYINSKINYLFTPPSSNLTLIIDEYPAGGGGHNQVYEAAEVYLRTPNITPYTQTLKVRKTTRQKTLTLTVDSGGEVADIFDGINLTWRFTVREETEHDSARRQFELRFHKKYKDKVVGSYLPHVLAKADAIKEEEKVVRLFLYNGGWTCSVNMEHPSTFETMAMEPETKKMIVEDLERFVRRREFYRKVGKAWKRGYLLYGPPGTGKSSLIGAMANFLKFDVFDLELTSIERNSDLRKVLLSTMNRSILVIEDIDCSVDLHNRESDNSDQDSSSNKLTLSGMLNFIDGLWSSCGDERIIVITTNNKDRLDPALLRPGRMDVHIHLSYCTANGFKVLASNYLGIHGNNRHRLCGEIERLMEETEVTPAEVAEELMRSDDADVALQGLVDLLNRKKLESKKVKDEEAKKVERQKMDHNGNDGCEAH